MLARRYDKSGRLRRSVKFVVAESKLEAEYIRRFLGQLSPLEESRLCELKYSLQSHHKGKLPNDAHLLRFLRARDFDVAKAKEMVHNSIIWRKQHSVDKLLQEWTANSVVAQFFPGCWHQSDKTGRPVFLLRLGALDIKGLIRSCGVEDVVKLTLSICEEGLNRTASATAAIGTPISSWTLLIDLEGLSMRHLWRPGIQALLKIIEIVEANYPETMGQVLVVRAPRVFPVLWTLISPLIHENTRNKIMINCGESCNDEIRKFIAEQYIPDFLGGTCITNCNNGGHIPKALYRDTEEISEDSDILASNYSKAAISRSAPFEIVIPISTTGCVLTWDFDVLKNDCSFAVYHTDKMLEKTKSASSSPPHSPTSPTAGMMDGFLSNHTKFEVACDPTLQKDVNLTIEEESVTFQEGDSMQGSHYCSKLGTYILQWKLNDQGRDTHHHNHSTSIDFGLGNHKCRIMYYYEILDSQDFRGSVASLESSRSSFSSIAPPSAPPTPKAK
ncbi:unnamed protein product [Auanema sp. JU1783]|nr:unnamed protein product [Auanema sp. JU1783]